MVISTKSKTVQGEAKQNCTHDPVQNLTFNLKSMEA